VVQPGQGRSSWRSIRVSDAAASSTCVGIRSISRTGSCAYRDQKRSTLSLPLNATTISTLQALHAAGSLVSPYVFPHTAGPKAGEQVRDIKNGFHKALILAEIQGFAWHDLRHTFASWLMMRGASLRSVAELLGHQSLKMTMRYAHLSPAFLSAGIGLLDPPTPPKSKSKRASKGHVHPNGIRAGRKW
jgi:integrase